MMTNAAAATGMENFRTILRHAFITCSLDGRRLPFLSRHFATINSTGDGEELKESNDTQKTNASVELMLFLELAAFVELFGATPKSRRRDIAKRIAFKFFLAHKIGNRVEKPMFDFSHLVAEKELDSPARPTFWTQIRIKHRKFREELSYLSGSCYRTIAWSAVYFLPHVGRMCKNEGVSSKYRAVPNGFTGRYIFPRRDSRWR
jgi:hypothetical protein